MPSPWEVVEAGGVEPSGAGQEWIGRQWVESPVEKISGQRLG